MALDQYRLQPLPPQRKPIWKMVAITLVSLAFILATFFFATYPRILCEETGGRWLTYSEWLEEESNRFVNYRVLSDNENEYFGKCIR